MVKIKSLILLFLFITIDFSKVISPYTRSTALQSNMRLSAIHSLVFVLFLDHFSQGLPQASLLHLPRASPACHSTQARAILSSPLGAPVFGVVDFRSMTPTDVQVEVFVLGLDRLTSHAEHPYHIHTHGVGVDGNCEAAGTHLTSAGIPDSVQCNATAAKNCQEGDMSGKHGLLPGDQRIVHLTYTDHQLQLNTRDSGIVGRGLVIHDGKGGRLACGNITLVGGNI